MAAFVSHAIMSRSIKASIIQAFSVQSKQPAKLRPNEIFAKENVKANEEHVNSLSLSLVLARKCVSRAMKD